ncbi:unnamed protein product [Rhizoctonia solani]|uniref:Uncharacterized protein n=1 Tax=Rhizoctonia solani TaxID=456999 RepID=A0A8H3CAP3_9AGAM|nr:unnamed protein product [Rhizoctonia solani]
MIPAYPTLGFPPSPPPSDIGSIESGSGSDSVQSCSGNSTSTKSTQPSDSGDHAPSKHSPWNSKFSGNDSTTVALRAIDEVLIIVVTCVKKFKSPPKLDFPPGAPSILILLVTGKNKSFINQLCELAGFRRRLNEIPTHNDAELIRKQKTAGMAIGKALQRMKERQILLYYIEFPDVALAIIGDIAGDLFALVGAFTFPSELDFPENTENGLVLVATKKTKPFINQLRKLNELRARLKKIPTRKDTPWNGQHAAADGAIRKALQKMKDYQIILYYLKFPDVAIEAIDEILLDHITYAMEFNWPSELDLLENRGNDPILLNTEKNKPFNNQLRKLNELQTRLKNIPMRKDTPWNDRHATASGTIEKSLQKMGEHQRELLQDAGPPAAQ